MKVVTSQLMRKLDAKTINEVLIPGVVLMENAGRSASEIIFKKFPDILKYKVVIFAGKGNNGGDGYVIARYLINHGVKVTTLCLTPLASIQGDAKINLTILQNLKGDIREILSISDLKKIENEVKESDLIIDAIFGTGLSCEVVGFYREVIDFINSLQKKVVSVDIPSGISADTGKPLGSAIKANLTITFGLPKLGQLIYPGADYVGELHVTDIGIPKSLIEAEDIKFNLIEEDILTHLSKRRKDSHKGNFGHLFVIAGSPGFTGAAYLSCISALKVGAGLVTLGIPKSLNNIMEVKLTEAMTLPLPEEEEGILGKDSIKVILDNCKRFDAFLIGPGISTKPSEVIFSLIKFLDKPYVIDADGLNIISQNIEILKEAKAPVILTPHPGEMARLIGKTTLEVQEDRVQTVRDFSTKFNCYTVLKGARTLISNPKGEVFINTTGNPGMASGGTGDVLAGMIGGFLAQKFSPEIATKLAVFIHGKAGDIAASKLGEYPLIASDLIENIPQVLI